VAAIEALAVAGRKRIQTDGEGPLGSPIKALVTSQPNGLEIAVGGLGILGVARALWVRRPGGRYPVAVRGHDRQAIFRRQSALVNAKGALQRLPGPAASELLSLAAVGNHRPNWTPVPTRPPTSPRAALKSQRDFGSQPNGCEARATLGVLSATVSTPSGLWPRPASANGPGIVPHKIPSPEVGDSNHAYKCLQIPNPRGI